MYMPIYTLFKVGDEATLIVSMPVYTDMGIYYWQAARQSTLCSGGATAWGQSRPYSAEFSCYPEINI